MAYTPEQKAWLLQQSGYSPEQFDISDDGFIDPKPAKVAVQPAGMSNDMPQAKLPAPMGAGSTFVKEAIHAAPAAAIGGIGAAGGAWAGGAIGAFPALSVPTAGLSIPIGAFLGGVGGAMGLGSAAANVQGELEQKYAPEYIAQREANIAANPWSGMGGRLTALTAGGMNPSLLNVGKAVTGQSGHLANVGIGAALGGGIPLGQQLAQGKSLGDALTSSETIEGTIGGTLFNNPNPIGKLLGFHPVPETARDVDPFVANARVAAMRKELAARQMQGFEGELQTVPTERQFGFQKAKEELQAETEKVQLAEAKIKHEAAVEDLKKTIAENTLKAAPEQRPAPVAVTGMGRDIYGDYTGVEVADAMANAQPETRPSEIPRPEGMGKATVVGQNPDGTLILSVEGQKKNLTAATDPEQVKIKRNLDEQQIEAIQEKYDRMNQEDVVANPDQEALVKTILAAQEQVAATRKATAQERKATKKAEAEAAKQKVKEQAELAKQQAADVKAAQAERQRKADLLKTPEQIAYEQALAAAGLTKEIDPLSIAEAGAAAKSRGVDQLMMPGLLNEKGTAPVRGTAWLPTDPNAPVQRTTTAINPERATLDTPGHENIGHAHIEALLKSPYAADQALIKRYITLAENSGIIDRLNKERIAQGLDPIDAKEYMATQQGFESIMRHPKMSREGDWKQLYRDTKARVKARLGNASEAEIRRVIDYKWHNMPAFEKYFKIPGGTRGTGVSARLNQDNEGPPLPDRTAELESIRKYAGGPEEMASIKQLSADIVKAAKNKGFNITEAEAADSISNPAEHANMRKALGDLDTQEFIDRASVIQKNMDTARQAHNILRDTKNPELLRRNSEGEDRGMKSLDYSPEDLAHYRALKAEQVKMQNSNEIMDAQTGEFSKNWMDNWKAFETVRNKYNGMPPLQGSGDFTRLNSEAEAEPKKSTVSPRRQAIIDAYKKHEEELNKTPLAERQARVGKVQGKIQGARAVETGSIETAIDARRNTPLGQRTPFKLEEHFDEIKNEPGFEKLSPTEKEQYRLKAFDDSVSMAINIAGRRIRNASFASGKDYRGLPSIDARREIIDRVRENILAEGMDKDGLKATIQRRASNELDKFIANRDNRTVSLNAQKGQNKEFLDDVTQETETDIPENKFADAPDSEAEQVKMPVRENMRQEEIVPERVAAPKGATKPVVQWHETYSRMLDDVTNPTQKATIESLLTKLEAKDPSANISEKEVLAMLKESKPVDPAAELEAQLEAAYVEQDVLKETGEVDIDLNAKIAKLETEIDNARKGTTRRNSEAEEQTVREKQQASPEFKKWFGDSKVVGSKGVGEEGKPLVMYHGRYMDFTVFDTERNNGQTLGPGAYFTPVKERAKKFQGESKLANNSIVEAYLSIKNPYQIGSKGAYESAKYDFLVSNPADYKRIAQKQWEKKYGSTPIGYDRVSLPEVFNEYLKEQGYDGIIESKLHQGEPYITEAVAFHPNQIKSATANRGTFDPNDFDIRHQEADDARYVPGIAPEVEKLRAISPVAGAGAHDFLTKFRGHIGAFEQTLIRAINKARPFDFSVQGVKDWIKQDNADNQAVVKYRNAKQDGEEPSFELTPVQQKINDAVNENLALTHTEREAREGLATGKGQKDNYLPAVMNREVTNVLTEKMNSPEYNRYKNDFIEYRTSDRRLEPQTPEEALLDWQTIRGGFTLQQKADRASQFGAIDKAMGKGLPVSMRETNLQDLMSRFNKRTARRIAYYDAIESKPEVTSAFFDKEQGVASTAVGKNVVEDIFGIRDYEEGLRNAASGLVRAGMMGTLTGAKDVVSGQVLGLQHMGLDQVLPAKTSSLVNWRSNYERAIKSGVIRHSTRTLETGDTGTAKIHQILGRVADVVNVAQGRTLLENVSRTLNFGEGVSLTQDALISLSRGQLTGARREFLENFMPDWQRYRNGDVPETAINEAAARYVESVQGTYDYRGLPAIAQKGSLALPLSLARWNIEKFNNFTKHVVTPATKGNYRPLLMSTVGMLIGGVAVNALVEEITGRKSRVPNFKEVEASKNQLEMLGYKLAALASMSGYTGVMGDVTMAGLNYHYGNKVQTWSNPLLSGLGTVAEEMGFLTEALASGDLPKATDVIGMILSDHLQAYRLAEANMSGDKQKKIEETNKRRDLKVYEMGQGLAVAGSEAKRPNPLIDTEAREFKQTDDMQKAMQLVGPLIQRAIEKANGNPEKLKEELSKLKRNSYQTVPSPELNPMKFSGYTSWMNKTQGQDETQKRITDYMMRNAKNKAKSSMIPSL